MGLFKCVTRFSGPGCSSFTGLVMELGPCRVTAPKKDGHVEVVENAWSWNNNASIIFLDQVSKIAALEKMSGIHAERFLQPVGVGYSYTDKGDKGVWTTEAAAKDVSLAGTDYASKANRS